MLLIIACFYRIDQNQYQWPNVEQLEDEWRDKNVFQSINLCVLQLQQLFNTPVGVLLSELQYMYENSSSSSPEDSEGMFA